MKAECLQKSKMQHHFVSKGKKALGANRKLLVLIKSLIYARVER